MNTDGIIAQIISLENKLLFQSGGKVVLAPPQQISETCGKMSILLANLAEPMFQAELDYKLARAARFDRLLQEGEKRTVAESLIKYDREMIRKELEVERLRNFVKRCDALIIAMQAHMKIKTAESRNDF